MSWLTGAFDQYYALSGLRGGLQKIMLKNQKNKESESTEMHFRSLHVYFACLV